MAQNGKGPDPSVSTCVQNGFKRGKWPKILPIFVGELFWFGWAKTRLEKLALYFLKMGDKIIKSTIFSLHILNLIIFFFQCKYLKLAFSTLFAHFRTI